MRKHGLLCMCKLVYQLHGTVGGEILVGRFLHRIRISVWWSHPLTVWGFRWFFGKWFLVSTTHAATAAHVIFAIDQTGQFHSGCHISGCQRVGFPFGQIGTTNHYGVVGLFRGIAEQYIAVRICQCQFSGQERVSYRHKHASLGGVCAKIHCHSIRTNRNYGSTGDHGTSRVIQRSISTVGWAGYIDLTTQDRHIPIGVDAVSLCIYIERAACNIDEIRVIDLIKATTAFIASGSI